jgi:hypothetical protein
VAVWAWRAWRASRDKMVAIWGGSIRLRATMVISSEKLG